MAKFRLRTKHTKPISLASYRMEKRHEHMPAVRVRVDVKFAPGAIVETDLDMSSWVTNGDIIEVKSAVKKEEPVKAPSIPLIKAAKKFAKKEKEEKEEKKELPPEPLPEMKLEPEDPIPTETELEPESTSDDDSVSEDGDSDDKDGASKKHIRRRVVRRKV